MNRIPTGRHIAGAAHRIRATATRRCGALLLLGMLASAAASTIGGAWAAESATVAAIRARGRIVCGMLPDNPPFSLSDNRGVWRGMDVDSCRALAATVLGNADKFTVRPISPITRFPAVQSGDVDVLFGSTTWTTTRETSLGLIFAAANYYSGQGFLVKRSLGVSHLAELNGATICVPPGSTTEVTMTEWFHNHNLTFQPILIEDLTQIQETFLSGRCDVFTRDMTGLSGFRLRQAHPDDFILLPENITMEPLGALIRKGDDGWFDVVRWTQFALVWAEQQGVTAATADGSGGANSSDVRRLLGAEGNVGPSMGLDQRWAATAIKAVGNYGEMWERNVAASGLARGLNSLWDKGGLMYSPPMR